MQFSPKQEAPASISGGTFTMEIRHQIIKLQGEVNMLRVLVNGADGRMGSQVVKAVFEIRN